MQYRYHTHELPVPYLLPRPVLVGLGAILAILVGLGLIVALAGVANTDVDPARTGNVLAQGHGSLLHVTRFMGQRRGAMSSVATVDAPVGAPSRAPFAGTAFFFLPPRGRFTHTDVVFAVRHGGVVDFGPVVHRPQPRINGPVAVEQDPGRGVQMYPIHVGTVVKTLGQATVGLGGVLVFNVARHVLLEVLNVLHRARNHVLQGGTRGGGVGLQRRGQTRGLSIIHGATVLVIVRVGNGEHVASDGDTSGGEGFIAFVAVPGPQVNGPIRDGTVPGSGNVGGFGPQNGGGKLAMNFVGRDVVGRDVFVPIRAICREFSEFRQRRWV